MTDKPLHLKSIRVRQFKAIADSGVVGLTPLTVFVGNNGAGKSSIIEALDFTRTLALEGLDRALEDWYGFEHVWHKGTDHTFRKGDLYAPNAMEINIAGNSGTGGYSAFTQISLSGKDNVPCVAKERLTLHRQFMRMRFFSNRIIEIPAGAKLPNGDEDIPRKLGRIVGTVETNESILARDGLLAESLDEEEKRIRNEGSKAMNEGDYDTATSVIDFAKRLLAFQKKVAVLEEEWGSLEDLRDKATPAVQEIVSKRFFGRTRSSDITPQEDYCLHILRVLNEIGGSGKTKDVIVKVGHRMKGILKPKDCEPTKTKPEELRWENNTRWARQKMVDDGRLKKDSKTGVWEISDKGRAWLKNQ